MASDQIAALVASTLLLLLAVFQLLLAAGVPWGRAAWRGTHRVLPKNLRLASLAATPVLVFAAWVVLARSSLAAPGPRPLWIRIMTWFFASYFTLNTLGNFSSPSNLEKWLMTPITIFLMTCFVIVALS
jgi:hypothetical protein